MGDFRAKRAGQRSRTVREDWFAWLPEEMDQLFGATRSELECSNGILSVALDEALALCEQEQFTVAKERVTAFAGLFDRLAVRLRLVIRTIEDHGSHFGTLPNVTALASENFRGTTAQRISFMDNLLARIVFRGRTRLFHKLHALKEIIEELQKETRYRGGCFLRGAGVPGTYLEGTRSARIRPEYLHGGDNGRAEIVLLRLARRGTGGIS